MIKFVRGINPMKIILATAVLLAMGEGALPSNIVSDLCERDGYNNYRCPVDGNTQVLQEIDTAPQSSGDEKLDHARAICVYHRDQLVMKTDPPTVIYSGPWKACGKVDEKWARSAAGLADRKRQEQEKRDLDLVNSVANDEK